MIPKTLSATSLQVFELCPARWKAEMYDKAAQMQGGAAAIGTCVHNTLEDFVRGVCIKKDIEWDEEVFWKIFHKHSDAVLGPDRTSESYIDARALAKRWFFRPGLKEELTTIKVISVESKSTFMMKDKEFGVEIPVNYIFDRFDQLGPNEYRVVDYKSQRVPLTASQLRKKLQARLYALMVQINRKDAEKIWVQFDFLRHEPVTILITRKDNVAMYRELQRRMRDIFNTDEDKAPETLNAECGWCIRKSSCKKLASNVNAGGILGKSPDELAELHQILSSKVKAEGELLDEIEAALLRYAVQEELLEFETDAGTVTVVAKKRRSVDVPLADMVLKSAGLADDYRRYSVTDLDKILKSEVLDPPLAAMLKDAIKHELQEPKVKIEYSKY